MLVYLWNGVSRTTSEEQTGLTTNNPLRPAQKMERTLEELLNYPAPAEPSDPPLANATPDQH